MRLSAFATIVVICAACSNDVVAAQNLFSIAGLKYGDTAADVKRTFGIPISTRSDDDAAILILRYYGPLDFYVSVDKKTQKVSDVVIYSSDAVDKIRARVGSDKLLDLFEASIDAVKRMLGEPDWTTSAILAYRQDHDGNKAEAQFSFSDGLCVYISVHWTYPQKTAATDNSSLPHDVSIQEHKVLPGFDVPSLEDKENWCWAACIQMVLNAAGHRVDQADIVKLVHGDVVDRGASMQVVSRALTDEKVNVRAQLAAPYTAMETVEQIDRGRAIIAATPGFFSGHHVVLIRGYQIDSDGNVILDIFDPYRSKGAYPKKMSDFPWLQTVITSFPIKPEKTSIDPNAEANISETKTEQGKIDWHANEEKKLIYFQFPFENTHPTNSVYVKFMVRTGSTLAKTGKLALDQRDWVPHESGIFDLTLPPLGRGVLKGNLHWFDVTKGRTLQVSHTVAECRYVTANSGSAANPVIPVSAFYFVGPIKYGFTSDQVQAILGSPESTHQSKTRTRCSYFADGVTISYDSSSRVVRFVSISSRIGARKLYQLSNNADDKLELYGASADEIRNSMGEKSLDQFGNLVYSIDNGLRGKGIQVEFECPARDNYRCKDINVMWTYSGDDSLGH